MKRGRRDRNRNGFRRPAQLRGVPTWVTCVRVTPTGGGAWEVTYAMHRGDDVHDDAVCASERFTLIRLVESRGRCDSCRDVGAVLRPRAAAVQGLAVCPECATVKAQLVLRDMVAESGNAMREQRNA